MKALFVNGSPRKNWNTYKMLESAMKGAAGSGADAELVNLYELQQFRGCISCFACKETRTRASGILTRDIYTAMIYTMSYPDEDGIKAFGYPAMFEETRRFMEQLFGYSEVLSHTIRISLRTIPAMMLQRRLNH